MGVRHVMAILYLEGLGRRGEKALSQSGPPQLGRQQPRAGSCSTARGRHGSMTPGTWLADVPLLASLQRARRTRCPWVRVGRGGGHWQHFAEALFMQLSYHPRRHATTTEKSPPLGSRPRHRDTRFHLVGLPGLPQSPQSQVAEGP